MRVIRIMMRNGLLAIPALCLLTAASFAGETIPSRIKEVTLFSNQALITRESVVKLNKGLHELLLDVDAFQVDSDSVSAKIFGEGEVFSVQFREIPLKEASQENIRTLEQKIRKLKRAERSLSDEKEVLNKKEQFLRSLINFSESQIPKDIKTTFPRIDDLNKTMIFIVSNLQNINGERQALDSRIEELSREIKVLEKERQSLQRSPAENKKVIEVLFNSKKDQQIRIVADYLARNAYWEPFYRASVPLTLGDVDLMMFSKIQQKTGEDWKGIALSISNVIPLRGVGLPALSSWFLDIERPRAKVRKKAERFDLNAAGAPAPSMEKARMAGVEEVAQKEAEFTSAQREDLPLSFEYRMPQTLSIESMDKDTMLPLFSRKLKGDFFHYAVPKVNTLTFLVCQASPDKELLSGYLNVYFGGRFIGKTFLSAKKAGEEFYLNLGADREVKVKRENTKDKIKETLFGTIGRNTIVREMAYKITLENIKDKPVNIKVLDTIPVSKTDKVEVQDVKITPQPKEKNYQDKEGVLLWVYQLKPAEKKEIHIEFVIAYPKDAPVLGL